MIERVTDRAVFDRFRSDGTRSRAGALTLVRLERPEAQRPAVAFAIPRRFGPAVRRNKLRRQLRTLFNDVAEDGSLASDAWLVIPAPDAAGVPYSTLRAWVRTAVDRQRVGAA